MVVRMLHYKIKPGKLEEYLSHFSKVADRTAGLEGLTFFEIMRDLKDPNTLLIAQVFEDDAALERYAEVGPDEKYTETVMPLIEEFGLAMTYEVSEAKPLF